MLSSRCLTMQLLQKVWRHSVTVVASTCQTNEWSQKGFCYVCVFKSKIASKEIMFTWTWNRYSPDILSRFCMWPFHWCCICWSFFLLLLPIPPPGRQNSPSFSKLNAIKMKMTLNVGYSFFLRIYLEVLWRELMFVDEWGYPHCRVIFFSWGRPKYNTWHWSWAGRHKDPKLKWAMSRNNNILTNQINAILMVIWSRSFFDYWSKTFLNPFNRLRKGALTSLLW